jgi:hypothetical protein
VNIYGIDFTSRPTRRKPITVAACILNDATLQLHNIAELTSLADFAEFLSQEGMWLAGIDAPFGLPRVFVETHNFKSWQAYASAFASIDKAVFLSTINTFKNGRAKGHKLPLRQTDRQAHSTSPLKTSFIPVGRMFYQLMVILQQKPHNIPLLRPSSDPRTLLETYPALVARTLIGKASYKREKNETPLQWDNRQRLQGALLEKLPDSVYSLQLELTTTQQERLLGDAKGDAIDALMCAVQAAWGYRQPGYNIPLGADALEGWIIDPYAEQTGV